MGPRPVWVSVAKDGSIYLGPWQFTLPRGVVGDERVRVVALVRDRSAAHGCAAPDAG
jgi:hypothetical protein